MPNPILLKFNATAGVVPGAAALTVRELALNTADGRLFTKSAAGTVVEFAQLGVANTWGNNQTFSGNSGGPMVTISNSGAGVGLALDDFTVTSTTKVTNLNADRIDDLDSTALIYGNANNGTNTAPVTWAGTHLTQYKSGFFDVNGAAWTPSTGWWWGINTAHTSNSAGYLYGGQIIFENAATPRVFVRVTNGGATPGATAWQQVLTATQGTYSGTLTSGQITAALGYTPGSAAGASVSVISTNTTAVAGTTYVLTASLTLTLPASPAAGNMVTVSNRSGVATCVVARNAQNIMGLAEDMTLDDSAPVRLLFADATRGWVLT